MNQKNQPPQNARPPQNQPPKTKDLRPEDLANQLFGLALQQHRGNAMEAASQTIMFLTEAVVAAVSAASGDNPNIRSGLLRQAGASLTAAAGPIVPPAAPAASPTDAKPAAPAATPTDAKP